MKSVTIHAPLGDGNTNAHIAKIHIFKVTIHAPLGDGNNGTPIGSGTGYVTIHAPLGDGNYHKVFRQW